MSEEGSFAARMRRIRAGDEQAAADLVRSYEPLLRRWARFRLRDPALARAFDSADVCQSVLASFFVRAAAGQFDLDRPDDLINLLLTMARNKMAMWGRRQRTLKRDGRRLADAPVEDMNPAGGEVSPSRHAAGKELLAEVRRLLTDEERQLADCRAQGEGWAEIAERLGGSPDGRRMQLTRALDRVSQQLGLDGDGPG